MFRLILCLIPPALSMSMGMFFKPGLWYLGLTKPWWTPPGFVFPIVWTFLYFLMGLNLFILSKSRELGRLKANLFYLQLIINALWSPVFFGFHRIGVALILLIFLFITLCLIAALFWKYKQRDQLFLLFPYICWVSIAAALNNFIYINN